MNSESSVLSPEKARQLLESGVHFGQQVSKRSPKMDHYVYGVARNGMQIINLDLTWKHLQQTGDLLRKLSSEDRNILFVGTNERAVARTLNEYAEKHQLNCVTSRWLGGTLTNPVTRNRINYLRELEGMEQSGLLESLSAKEKSFIGKKLKKLRRNLNGLKKIKGAINAIVIVDPMTEINATLEALKKSQNMLLIAITDTNCRFSPDQFDQIIPCNVSSISSLREIMSHLVACIEEGRQLAGQNRATQISAGPGRRPGARGGLSKKPSVVRNLRSSQPSKANTEEPAENSTPKPAQEDSTSDV